MSRTRSRYRDIIAIGSSAGGTQTLTELVGGLPAELPATLLVAQHISPASPGVLPAILGRAGPLPVSAAVDGEPIERGHMYVAPPDHHLLLGDDRLHVTRGPRENGHRPAVDPLFRSAARHFGRRVIAVVLSGTLDDGTAGLVAVKARGGLAVVQDPKDARYPGMPESAIAGDHPDHVVPISELAALVCTLVQEPLRPLDIEPTATPSELVPAALTCPECGGPLFERQEGPVPTVQCLVGHRYTPASLDHEQARQLETVLWTAARSLYERAELLRRLADQPHAEAQGWTERYAARARACEEQAEAVTQAINQLGSTADRETEPIG